MIEKKRLLVASIYILLCACAVAISGTLVKVARSEIPLQFILFTRFGISLLYVISILLILKARKKTISLVPHNIKLHILRTLATGGAIVLVYFTIHYIPIYESILGNMTYPLFVPVLLYLTEHFKLSKNSIFGTLVGFLGTVFVLLSHTQYNMSINIYFLLAIFSGFLAAWSAIFAEKLTKHNHPYTIMLYYFLIATIIAGCCTTWIELNPRQWVILIAIGLTGALYQEFFIRALQFSRVNIATSLMYVSIIFSIIINWLFWHQGPDLLIWFGVILISIGSIVTIGRQ